MNIFKTFELFLKQPISILKSGLISIVHLKAENLFSQKANNNSASEEGITVQMLKDKAQITVINNEKVYNLLKMVTYRAGKKKSEKDSVKLISEKVE